MSGQVYQNHLKIAQVMGTEAAYKYVNEQTGGGTSAIANAAKQNAMGVAMTDYYKKMMAAQGKK